MFEQDSLLARLHEIAEDGVAIGLGFNQMGQPKEHLCTYDDAWQKHYWENELIFSDPVIAFGVNNLGAVRWSDVTAGGAANAVTIARDFGLTNGIVLSVQVDGERAIAGLATRSRPSEAAITEARIVLAALQASKSGEPQIILTQRQKEVLRLIADGASAEDTAHELEIDISTVNFHKREALKKNHLHAKNFTSLLASAIRAAVI